MSVFFVRLFFLFFSITIAGCGWAETTSFNIPDEVVKWPLKSPSHLITIRIPGGYRYLGGVAMSEVTPIYPAPDAQGTYTDALFAEALWPDMVSRTPKNRHEFDAPGKGGRKFRIVAGAIIDWGDRRREREMDTLDRVLKFDANQFTTREEKVMERYFYMAKGIPGVGSDGQIAHHFSHPPIEPMPGKFGLERVGVDFTKYPAPLELGSRLNDVYYLRDKQRRLLTFIKCTSEAYRDHEDAPTSVESPYCTQHFFFAPLNGSVEVRYRRKYLGDWREIQAKTERLLQSFIQR